MIRLLFALLTVLLCSSVQAFDSRFGELTEMFDPKMRGQNNQWVRPHPGPFVWSMIEPKENDFFWKDADQYVNYAQNHNQRILATIWPYAKWDQKTCNKKKKSRSPFGKHFPKRLNKPCSMEKYLHFLELLVDRYDGDGNNDMPGLSNPITHWEIMNEPEFKMFFNGTENEFVEIFIASSKLIRSKQQDAVIVMAGAAGMHPESRNFWTSAMPKINDSFDIANIHHITGPNGDCDKDMWVSEFAKLLNKLKINKPIWVTEAMTGKCKAVPTYVRAFLNGAEIIFDVGINAPGPKMSKKERAELSDFFKKYDNFTAIKLKNNDAEFTYKDNSKKTLSLK